MRRRGLLIVSALLLTGCDNADMVAQRKSASWDRSAFLPDGATMQAPVPGTVARDVPNQPVTQPVTITQALLVRGQQRFDIFCTPCHGLAGQGDGMIVQRGFPKPTPLADDRLMKAKAQYFYDVISNGRGTMYGFAAQVPPADRWAIVAYIKALQGSQHPDVPALPVPDQAALKEQHT